MKYPALLLIASTAALAIPLRQGATLVYHVERGWESDTTIATLTVKDSVRTDSGTQWNVIIRDSVIGKGTIRLDTAVLLNKGADTVWTQPSCLVAWDPAHRKVESAKSNGSLPMPFGALGAFCSVGLDSSTYGPLPSTSTLWYALNGYRRELSITDGAQITGSTLDAQRIPLTSSVGEAGWSRWDEPFLNERWLIRSCEGKPIVDTTQAYRGAELTVSLDPGTRWAWRTGNGTTSTSDHMIKILHAIEDSAGWIRRTILEDTLHIELRISLFDNKSLVQPAGSFAGYAASGFIHIATDSLVSEGVWSRDGSSWSSRWTTSSGSIPVPVVTTTVYTSKRLITRGSGATLVDDAYLSSRFVAVPLSLAEYDSKMGLGDSASRDSVIAPLSLGERWNWMVSQSKRSDSNLDSYAGVTDTTFKAQWVITAVPADSAGWIRRTFSEDTADYVITQVGRYGEPLAAPVVRATPDTTHFELRYQPETFTLVVTPENQVRRKLVSGFFLDGTEIPYSPGVSTRPDLTMTSGIGPSAYGASSVSSSVHSPLWITTTFTRSFGLAEHALPVRRTSSKPILAWVDNSRSLLSELAAHPGSEVDLIDASGRSQRLDATEAIRRIPSIHGFRAVRLLLPDRVVPGRILLP